MPGFMTSAAGAGVMSFLTKGIGSKLIFYVVIVWFLTGCVNLLASYLPAALPADIFGGMPSYLWYFLDYLMIPQFMSAYYSILVLKWILRKIPLVGD